MAEKITVMKLKADLQCPCCYKKIQKILCRIPQIRDRVFDEKVNTVTITVICCSPEKIRDKLSCKGGKVIKSIEIIEPPKPPKPKDDKPKETPKPKDDKTKETPKPKDDKTKETPKPKPAAEKSKETDKPKTEEAAKPKSNGKGNAPPQAAAEKPKDASKSEPPKNPAPAPEPTPAPAPGPGAIPVGLPPVYPVRPCCGPCYEGFSGGPCYHGYGFPPPPPRPCYDSNYGPGYVYGRPSYVTKCEYFSDENSTGCTIM